MTKFNGILNSMGSMTFSKWIAPSVDIPEGSQEVIDEFVRRNACGTFVLLEGGADIDPAIYGEKNTYSHIGKYSQARDTHERMVIDAALKNDVPIFGICRGHQLLAAHLGGKLYQDIGIETGFSHRPNHYVETLGIFHDFRPDAIVNSYHHQAVSVLPTDAIEVARHVHKNPSIDLLRMYINEAIIYPKGAYPVPMFSVQWHPEMMGDSNLVDWVVETLFGFDIIHRDNRDDDNCNIVDRHTDYRQYYLW